MLSSVVIKACRTSFFSFSSFSFLSFALVSRSLMTHSAASATDSRGRVLFLSK